MRRRISKIFGEGFMDKKEKGGEGEAQNLF